MFDPHDTGVVLSSVFLPKETTVLRIDESGEHRACDCVHCNEDGASVYPVDACGSGTFYRPKRHLLSSGVGPSPDRPPGVFVPPVNTPPYDCCRAPVKCRRLLRHPNWASPSPVLAVVDVWVGVELLLPSGSVAGDDRVCF